jgi:hypothetical protein
MPRVTESRADAIGLWFALVFPSSFIVRKYLGWESTIAYAIAVAALVSFVPRPADRFSKRTLLLLWIFTIAAVVITFVVLYPVANTHVPGTGSDDDDALEAATRAILAGRSPYSVRTYLGNAVHHLPGAFILAAPFVLIGATALQNLFWLAAFFAFVIRRRDAKIALSTAWLVLILSPAVMYEVVTGTGYVSNSISVALGLWWLASTTAYRDVAAITWGVTLAARANFILLVPLAFAWIQRQTSRQVAIRTVSITCATIALLTIPLYLHDPPHFTPLEGANRLFVFDQLVPHLGVGLIAAMTMLAVALGVAQRSLPALFRNCAIVQAFPVVAGVVLASVVDRRVNLTYARYGAFFAWFVFMAQAVADSGTTAAAAHGKAVIVR